MTTYGENSLYFEGSIAAFPATMVNGEVDYRNYVLIARAVATLFYQPESRRTT